MLFTVLFVRNIYSFLAVNDRLQTDTLVVEGWVSPFAIKAAAHEFNSGHYARVLVTGGPVRGSGGYTNDYNTSASVGADELKAAGIPAQLVQMVPSRINSRDRTYSEAVALGDWFTANHDRPAAINVLTEALHARRSRLLFQMALGPGITVGAIPVQNPDYDASEWWKYSEGVKDVETETLGYAYARIFFHPSH